MPELTYTGTIEWTCLKCAWAAPVELPAGIKLREYDLAVRRAHLEASPACGHAYGYEYIVRPSTGSRRSG